MTVMTNRLSKFDSTTRTIALVMAALVVCAVGMAACSTTEGFGRDVKHLGGNIESSAERNK